MVSADEKPRRRRRRIALFVLAALVIVLLFTFAVLELVTRSLWDLPPAMAEFRQAGLYVQTPSGGTALAPGYRGTLQLTPDLPANRVEINSLGMRGAEIAAKRAGEHRVLVVGDSLVFGYGVEAEQTFAARLEARLRERGAQVTVGNGGVSGFGSFEAAQRLLDLRPTFAPDVAVFCVYLGNDAFDNRNRDFMVVGGLRFTGPMAALMRDSWRARMAAHSRFLLWCETWLVTNAPQHSLLPRMVMSPDAIALREGFPGTAPEWGATHAGLFLDVIDDSTAWPPTAPPVMPRVLADFRTALLAARAGASGVPLLVLILPTWWHVDAEAHRARLAELKFDPARFRRGCMQERLRSLCAELSLPVLDATPWLENAPQRRASFLADGGHLTAAGHEIVAAQIEPTIVEMLR